jgi:hypothetical protein
MTTTLPVPAGVYATFYPTSVVLPDRTVWHRCKAYATDQGLFIYRAAPTGPGDPEPAFWAEVNMAATRRPMGQASTGWWVTLETGEVLTITGGGGCGCGNPLKGWHPSWAGRLLEWPA